MRCFAGVDVGGTFTDVVVGTDTGATHVRKLLTTHDDPRRAVVEGLLLALGDAGADPADLARVVHGTTLVTNAVIERHDPAALDRAYDRAAVRIGMTLAKLARPARAPATFSLPAGAPLLAEGEAGFTSTMNESQFVDAVHKAKEFIAAGDAYQIVLSRRLDCRLTADPFTVYRALRTINPSPYLFLLRLGPMSIVGSSPEVLVRVEGEGLLVLLLGISEAILIFQQRAGRKMGFRIFGLQQRGLPVSLDGTVRVAGLEHVPQRQPGAGLAFGHVRSGFQFRRCAQKLFVGIAKFLDVWMPEQRVVVEVHLGVERQ